MYEPPETPEPDPIGPYTPEAAEAVQSASDARQSSASLRREIKECIDKWVFAESKVKLST